MCAVMGLAFVANAQRPQLQLGYGGFTQMDCSNMHGGTPVNNAWGAMTAGLNLKVSPQLLMGMTYTYSSASYKNLPGANAYYHVLMFNGSYYYYSNSIVRLYAHAGIGVDITHMAYGDWSRDKSYVAFQASPLGAEVDINKGLSMFGELGYGAQGLLQVGLRYTF